ncbi:hypothetical protein SDC9_127313 [bioreactor metagenome]|uniref:Uncharacterized protein n=1 Tax=bioreactor metagenome TaxID=1076179 RepID=A0A645CT12_9ZZZZ
MPLALALSQAQLFLARLAHQESLRPNACPQPAHAERAPGQSGTPRTFPSARTQTTHNK